MKSYELEQEFVEYWTVDSKENPQKHIAEMRPQYLTIEVYGDEVVIKREARIDRRTSSLLLPASFALDLAKVLILAHERGLIEEESITCLPSIKEFVKELPEELKKVKPKKIRLTDEAREKIENGDYYKYYYKYCNISEDNSNPINYEENIEILEQ